MENFQTLFVVNPASGGGSTWRRWPEMRAELSRVLGELDVAFTTGPGQATSLARRAIERGVEMVVAVGGDGTVSEVAGGFFDGRRALNPDAVLGVLESGTGGDFRRTLGLPSDLPGSARALAGRSAGRLDVGLVTLASMNGATIVRHFVNVAEFGLGGVIVQRVNRSSKRLGGFLSFLGATLRATFSFSNKPVQMRVDDGAFEERVIKNVVVAGGRYFGGGMCIAPRAELDDGLFDVLIAGDLGAVEFLRRMRGVYKAGREPEEVPGLERFRARRVEARSDEQVLVDLDGEMPGTLPATFEVLPGAIRLKRAGVNA